MAESNRSVLTEIASDPEIRKLVEAGATLAATTWAVKKLGHPRARRKIAFASYRILRPRKYRQMMATRERVYTALKKRRPSLTSRLRAKYMVPRDYTPSKRPGGVVYARQEKAVRPSFTRGIERRRARTRPWYVRSSLRAKK